MTCLVPLTCPMCLVPYGGHKEGCQVPAPPAPHDAEETLACAMEAWLRGGPVPASHGYRYPEEPALP